jgi:hypothetical protein
MFSLRATLVEKQVKVGTECSWCLRNIPSSGCNLIYPFVTHQQLRLMETTESYEFCRLVSSCERNLLWRKIIIWISSYNQNWGYFSNISCTLYRLLPDEETNRQNSYDSVVSISRSCWWVTKGYEKFQMNLISRHLCWMSTIQVSIAYKGYYRELWRFMYVQQT